MAVLRRRIIHAESGFAQGYMSFTISMDESSGGSVEPGRNLSGSGRTHPVDWTPNVAWEHLRQMFLTCRFRFAHTCTPFTMQSRAARSDVSTDRKPAVWFCGHSKCLIHVPGIGKQWRFRAAHDSNRFTMEPGVSGGAERGFRCGASGYTRYTVDCGHIIAYPAPGMRIKSCRA